MSGRSDERWSVLRDRLADDYFTPAYKAEVVFDTLLTPYVAGMLESRLPHAGDIVYIAKELPFDDPANTRAGNLRQKADYLLADEKSVYLVELKTTDSSIKPEQKTLYRRLSGETFGNMLGARLLEILAAEGKSGFGVSLEQKRGDRALHAAWAAVWKKLGFRRGVPESGANAKKLIRDRGWAWIEGCGSKKAAARAAAPPRRPGPPGSRLRR